MRTIYYPTILGLLFCVILPLTAGLDLGKIISTAQCQSSCLRNLTTDDKCWNVGRNENTECQKCWQSCEFLGSYDNDQRSDLCNKNIFFNCSSCSIACTFYRTHRIEKDQYESTKLPAPEGDEVIRMNKHDVAVIMRKSLLGIWEIQKDYTANQEIEMRPGKWIIITNENGAIRHYSWEKWQPRLQSLKKNGPLFQANITWTDWEAQLKKQREEVSLPGDRVFLELQNRKMIKPSFIVTWEEETGNGIMGNQVADSESAQISLPPGKYFIRIATNEGPGSYSIVIDANSNDTKMPKAFYRTVQLISLLSFLVFSITIISISLRIRCLKTQEKNESNMEMTCSEAKMRPNKLNKLEYFKCKLNQINNHFAGSCTDHISKQLWIKKDNANASKQDANVPNVNINMQDENANSQDKAANTKNITMNMIHTAG